MKLNHMQVLTCDSCISHDKTAGGLKLRSAFPRFFSNHVQRESSFQGRSRKGRTVVEGTVNRIYPIVYIITFISTRINGSPESDDRTLLSRSSQNEA